MPYSSTTLLKLLTFHYTHLLLAIFLVVATQASSSSASHNNSSIDILSFFPANNNIPADDPDDDYASLYQPKMSVFHEQGLGWHPGEAALQRMLRVPSFMNPTSHGLPRAYAIRAAMSPLAALGALDDRGRPWCTIWGGERFMRPVAPNVLAFAQRAIDNRYDPVLRALFARAKREEDGGLLIRPGEDRGGDGDEGQLMAGLSIDLDTRDRVKLAGRLVAGALVETDGGDNQGGKGDVAEVQLAMLVQETLGNCPKYLNRRDLRTHVPRPRLVSDTLPLSEAAVELIRRADLFFLSSTDGSSMDANHRGGAAGFVRVVRNSAADGVALIYPEFSGNRMYQTLGNMHLRPLVGVVVPDFESGDVLYLTGETTILVGDKAAAYLPHAKLAVKIDVKEARFVADGLPFRGGPVDYSPYNPAAWKLASEGADASRSGTAAAAATARLLRKEVLTPNVTRFTFRLCEGGRPGKGLPTWAAGQHVTMDFSEELDVGYSHMRDDDPQSLNDDYIRTFTVSSVPPLSTAAEDEAGMARASAVAEGPEFEVTVRKNGPVTSWLFGRTPRVGLEVPVLAFGGEAGFRIPTTAEEVEHVFVAGGVGITPLLSQAPAVLAAAASSDKSRLRLLWALRAEDLGLAVDTFKRIPGLAGATTLFVTGKVGEWESGLLSTLQEMGTGSIRTGRMTKEAVLEYSGGSGQVAEQHGPRKYYVCAGAALVKELVRWLEKEDMVMESFAY